MQQLPVRFTQATHPCFVKLSHPSKEVSHCTNTFTQVRSTLQGLWDSRHIPALCLIPTAACSALANIRTVCILLSNMQQQSPCQYNNCRFKLKLAIAVPCGAMLMAWL